MNPQQTMVTIYNGDVLNVLKEIEDDYYNAVLTDPPYGLSSHPDIKEVLSHWMNDDKYDHKGKGFLNAEWDSFVPGPLVWQEIYRVCKPGAILLSFCGTRTSDLMSIAIRMGGWQKFDEIDVFGNIDWISYLTATGFPKSFNLSRQWDKRNNQQGEVIETKTVPDQRNGHGREYGSHLYSHSGRENMSHSHYAPVSEEAKRWYDYGTSLCPAHEVVLIFRKPFSGTYLDNAEKYGTGVFNIGGARIPTEGKDKERHLAEWDRHQSKAAEESVAMNEGLKPIDLSSYKKEGRWPKNVIFADSDAGLNMSDLLPSKESKSKKTHRGSGINGNLFKSPEYSSTVRGHNDQGGVQRFFYTAKASTKERGAGLTKNENKHPTVKPIDLTKYLATLVLPPKDMRANCPLLVPFSGVGSEVIGAVLAGWERIDAIELEEKYVDICTKRTNHWMEVSNRLDTVNEKEIANYNDGQPIQRKLQLSGTAD